jgi:hypothetical protein
MDLEAVLTRTLMLHLTWHARGSQHSPVDRYDDDVRLESGKRGTSTDGSVSPSSTGFTPYLGIAPLRCRPGKWARAPRRSMIGGAARVSLRHRGMNARKTRRPPGGSAIHHLAENFRHGNVGAGQQHGSTRRKVMAEAIGRALQGAELALAIDHRTARAVAWIEYGDRGLLREAEHRPKGSGSGHGRPLEVCRGRCPHGRPAWDRARPPAARGSRSRPL